MVAPATAAAELAAWQPRGEEQRALQHALLAFLAARPDDACSRSCEPGHLTASALVLDADGERTLLTLHPRVGRWLQLGGHCEDADVSLRDAALREATEESGIPGLRIDPVPIDVDIHPVPCQGGSFHHDVRFAVLAPPGAVERVSDESEALGWFPPDRLPTPRLDGVDQLLAPGLAALRRGLLRPAP